MQALHTVLDYTVLKNTHSCFLLYLCGKSSDFHKIFRKCSGENSYFTSKKVKYFPISEVTLTSYFCVCGLWVLPLKTDI